MARQVMMRNAATGATAIAYQGLSWTSLFFGFMPAIFRGAHGLAFIIFLLCFWSFGLFCLVLLFIFNGWHRSYLEHRGYAVINAPGEAPTALKAAPPLVPQEEEENPIWAAYKAKGEIIPPAVTALRSTVHPMRQPRTFGKRVTP